MPWLVIEALEDRLCPSIDLLVTSYYFGDVLRHVTRGVIGTEKRPRLGNG
jgi:hypothetical protein